MERRQDFETLDVEFYLGNLSPSEFSGHYSNHLASSVAMQKCEAVLSLTILFSY